MKRYIIAGLLFAGALSLMAALTWHEKERLIAPGKRTEGLCPPFCDYHYVATGKPLPFGGRTE